MIQRRPLCLSLVALLVSVPLAASALPRQNPFAPQPSKEHALLRQLDGTWSAKFAMTMPGIPPIESSATEDCELLGDLWLVSRYEDPNMMGGTFSGAQLFGYDPDKKKYVAAWVDNQSATLALQEGTYSEAEKTLTLIGESVDPMTGKPSTSKSIMRWIDADHRESIMMVPGPDGSEMEMFKITYERKK